MFGASRNGATRSTPPPPPPSQAVPRTPQPSQISPEAPSEPDDQTERIPDTLTGVTLPDFYTSPIPIPPEIIPIIADSVTASSDTPEPAKVQKKPGNKISYK